MIQLIQYFIAFLLLLPFCSQAKETICLNMIVKNESGIIKRCLDSVKPVIDYWVIVDTGSTDGTQEIIKEYMKDIPGELHERPWKNFGHNRTEAIQLANGKSDYILIIDADDKLVLEPDFQPDLKLDLYHMWRGTDDFSYLSAHIVKGNLPWRWVGVVHEYLECDRAYTSGVLNGVKNVIGSGGANSKDPQKFLRYVNLLLDGLKEEPNNTRYRFYLAESYKDAGMKEQAIEAYQKRIDMNGWDEEVFWSYLQIAHLKKELGHSIDSVIDSYYRAHRFRPHRSEPVYYLAEIYNQQQNYQMAYECLKGKLMTPRPLQKDLLFNMEWIDKYGLLFQLSICSYYIGFYQESLVLCDALLKNEKLPEHLRNQTELNRSFPLMKLNAISAEKTAN